MSTILVDCPRTSIVLLSHQWRAHLYSERRYLCSLWQLFSGNSFISIAMLGHYDPGYSAHSKRAETLSTSDQSSRFKWDVNSRDQFNNKSNGYSFDHNAVSRVHHHHHYLFSIRGRMYLHKHHSRLEEIAFTSSSRESFRRIDAFIILFILCCKLLYFDSYQW